MRFASVTTLCQFLDPTNGHLPLSYTAQYGGKVVVKMLVAWDDVKVNTKDNSDHGHSLLSYATENENEAVVQILLRWDDVEVNTKDQWGFSPLSYTAENRHEAVVKMLVVQDEFEVNTKDNLPWPFTTILGHWTWQ